MAKNDVANITRTANKCKDFDENWELQTGLDDFPDDADDDWGDYDDGHDGNSRRVAH